MRYLSVIADGARHIAARCGDELISLSTLMPDAPCDMAAFIAEPNIDARARAALDRATTTARLPDRHVRYLPAVPRPGKVICLGLNYRDHAEEIGMPIPEYPVPFMRGPTSLTGHLQPLLLPRGGEQFDYEAELAVVIGRAARHVPEGRAQEYVFGVTCFNDASLREHQFRTSQWTAGKNFDGTGALGPEIVTLDELPCEPDALGISCRVNGTTRQRSNTAQHVFGVNEAVAILSSLMTLEPGDVIALGTPSGVAMALTPQPWLRPGDVCEVEVQGIGVLRNTVVAEP